MRIFAMSFGLSVIALTSAGVQAQTPDGLGAPPPDAEALASGPKGPTDAPTIAKPKNDSTSVTLSAGGLLTSGNSRTVAMTINGAFDMRRGSNGFGASILGNYGEAAPKPGADMMPSAENVQGRVRYDRYFGDRASVFLITTGRYDKFQGLAFRLNLDPGFKYIVIKTPRSAAWAEAGYDFLYDVRTDAGRREVDANGVPTGVLLDPTRTDHSARLFVGFRRAFTQDITFSTGLEYLQSFIKTDLGDKNSRFNLNAVLAAKLFKGFSLGIGFNAAYDRLPIPGREQLDTTTTVSLIYGWSDATQPKKEEKPKCPVCPEVKPPPVTPPQADSVTPVPADSATSPANPKDDAVAPPSPPVAPAPSEGDAVVPVAPKP
jgi:hypothetical protein